MSRVSKLFLLIAWAFLSAITFAEEEQAQASAISSYIDLRPAFVTNYGSGSRLHYLKAEISLRVTESAVDAVKHHMPAIRHEIVMLLSSQDNETVVSSDGKESIRVQALAAVRECFEKEEEAGQIEDLLFTSFIVQR
jgi:flagellar FliL protein